MENPIILMEISTIGLEKPYILIECFDKNKSLHLLAKVPIEYDKVTKKIKMDKPFQTGENFEKYKDLCRKELMIWWKTFQLTYISHCYKCKNIVMNTMTQCEKCNWYICAYCNACGCEYGKY